MARRCHERRSCWECRADFIARRVDEVFCSVGCGLRRRVAWATDRATRANAIVRVGFHRRRVSAVHATPRQEPAGCR